MAERMSEYVDYPASTSIAGAAGGAGFAGPWVADAPYPAGQGSFLQVSAGSLFWPGESQTGGHLLFDGGDGSYRYHGIHRPLAEALAPGEYFFTYVYLNADPGRPGSSSGLALGQEGLESLRITLAGSTEIQINNLPSGLHITPDTPQLIQLRLILNGPGQLDSVSLWVNPEPGTGDDPGYTNNLFDLGNPDTLEISAWGNQTIGWDSMRLLTSAEFFDQPPMAPVAATRDPWQWPFARNSIWNTPRGANARLIPAGLPQVYDQTTVYIGLDLERHIQVPADAPLRPIYPGAGWPILWPGDDSFEKPSTPTWADLPLPDDFRKADNVPGYTPNSCTTFLMPDGRTLRQMQPTVRLWDDDYPDRRIVGWPAAPVDLYGLGTTGSHFGSGLSTLGGSLRVGELSSPDPIPHALKLNIWARHLHYGPSGGFRWPADRADDYASPQTYTGSNPALQMGSLLVIPAQITAESLNITSAPGLKFFEALRDYGCYIADDSAWNGYDFCAEDGIVAEVAAMGYALGGRDGQLNEELRRMIAALHIVDDNAPQSTGGAGPRMAPPAPRLVDPLFTSPLAFTAERQGAEIMLHWQAPSWSADAYEVERKIGDGDWDPLTQTAHLSLTDTPAEASQSLTYRIRGIEYTTDNAGSWVEATTSSDYPTWAEQLPEGQAATTDSINGVPNLLRYALGGDLHTPASDFQLGFQVDSSAIRLDFTRIDDPRLTYEIWLSEDLIDWGEAPHWFGTGYAPGPLIFEHPGPRWFIKLSVRLSEE